MSAWHTIQVVEFCIGDDDEGHHTADNPQSFEDTNALLEELRAKNPTVTYTMFAEVDA